MLDAVQCISQVTKAEQKLSYVVRDVISDITLVNSLALKYVILVWILMGQGVCWKHSTFVTFELAPNCINDVWNALCRIHYSVIDGLEFEDIIWKMEYNTLSARVETNFIWTSWYSGIQLANLKSIQKIDFN